MTAGTLTTGAPGRRRPRRRWVSVLLVLALAVALGFLVLPVVAIFVDAPPGELLSSLGDPVARDALRLSIETSAIAMALVVLVGTPAAWLLATRSFPGRSVLVTALELPLVLPPAVAGIALLAALGPHGLLGGALDAAGVQLVVTTAGVVVALAFVAGPLYLRQAQAAFAALDAGMLEVARTLGASEARVLLRVALPLARGGLFAGLGLGWARALGEFGATLIFAGSFRGVTQTVPLAIYERFARDLPGALALSGVLVVVSAALLLGVRLAAR